jgi:hypothetical protein
MRDARRFSAREVSQGVQRHVLDQTTWFGSTVMAHSGAAPLVFELLTARFCPADQGRSQSRIAATVTVTVAWKTRARLMPLWMSSGPTGVLQAVADAERRNA